MHKCGGKKPKTRCGKCKATLFTRDFRVDSFVIGDGPTDFSYFQVPLVYIADDGTPTQTPEEGLTITSVPFTKRALGILDHPKYLVLNNARYPIPKYGVEIQFQARMTYQATGLIEETPDGPVLASGIRKYSDGIQNVQDEPRLSAGALNVIDLVTGMVFDFILSNSTVYALYEHLPVTDDTAVFTYAIPIYSFSKAGERVNLKLGFSKQGENTLVRYYVNDVLRYTVSDIGLPLVDQTAIVLSGGGDFKKVELQGLQFGFGTFTLLDFLPFDKSYEQIGQSYTVPLNTSTLEKVQPLANLMANYFQRMKNQVGELVPQTEFVYTGQPEDDGTGAIISITTFTVCLRGKKPLSHCYHLDYERNLTHTPASDMTQAWKIEPVT